MKKIESNNMIVKSNQLIETQYRLTAIEQKIIYMVSSLIKKEDQDFKTYTIRICDLIDVMDTKAKSSYNDIKMITAQLKKKTFTISDVVKNSDLQISWFSSIEYFNGAGIVEFEFSPKLKPYLLQLKNHFTKFDLEEVMQLRSAYSLRIHELLRQYYQGGIRERKFSMEDLRRKLGISEDEYKLYANFKNKVILQAQREINSKMNINFEFEEIKTGRKVTALKFIISQNDLNENDRLTNSENLKIKQAISTIDLVNEVKQQFENKYKGKLIDKFVKDMLQEKGIEYVRVCLEDYKNHLDGRNIGNIAGDFYTFVMNGYEKPVAYKNTPSYANFDQREYNEEDFERFYANLNIEK